MDPAQWMALLQQGDEEALERLLTHYDGMLRYIAGGILDHPQELEDCLAQVRLKLWESRGQYDPERSSPATWLTALCRSAAVDRLRKAKRQNTGELPETHPDPAPGPEEQLLQKERVQALERALNALSARDRNLGAGAEHLIRPGPESGLPEILLPPVHRPDGRRAGSHRAGGGGKIVPHPQKTPEAVGR